METFLNIRQKCKSIYGRYSTYIKMLAKFLTALIVLNTINSKLGYMSFLSSLLVVLAVSVLSSILPWGAITFFSAVFVLGHMWSLSIEAFALTLTVMVVLAIVHYLMLPGCTIAAALVPVLFCWHIPYIAPIIVGLTCGITGFAAVGTGTIMYFLIETISANAGYLADSGTATILERMNLLVNTFVKNQEMMVVVLAFCMSAAAVYLIRRLKIDYAHYIAIGAGAILMPVILLMGSLSLDVEVSVAGAFLGCILAAALAAAYQFGVLALDYAAVEYANFEDEDYVYYVKAVPKMNLTEKKVKLQSITAPFSAEDEKAIREAVEQMNKGEE